MLEVLYKKVISGQTMQLSELLDFIRESAKAINPSASYNEDITMAAIRSGFIDSILLTISEAIEKNPDKVGFQVTKLWSGTSLIKVYTHKIK